MERYFGSEIVGPGVYFNPRQLSFKSINEEGPLPGSEAEEYRRVPTLALLVFGPMMGLVYIIFLPLIGFAMVAWVGLEKARVLATSAVSATVRVLEPAWQPAMAFFSRRKTSKKAAKHEDEWSEGVKKDLDEGDGKA